MGHASVLLVLLLCGSRCYKQALGFWLAARAALADKSTVRYLSLCRLCVDRSELKHDAALKGDEAAHDAALKGDEGPGGMPFRREDENNEDGARAIMKTVHWQ
jgi:hypothetical protein